jgi:heme oxygenase
MRLAMAKPVDHAAREARLAAKLRENLHRRKAQARALDTADRTDGAENDSAALSKQPPES